MTSAEFSAEFSGQRRDNVKQPPDGRRRHAFSGRVLSRRRGSAVIAGIAVGVLALVSACSSTNSTGTGTASASDTIRWAESAGYAPQWIFPLFPAQYFTVQEQSQFEYLMFPPLYNFGNGASPELNLADSLGQAPQYSADSKSVTITLNKWKWSDGTPVTARDVQFWINLVKGNRGEWAAYTPGGFPDNITKVTLDSTYKLTLNLTQAYNHEYFTLDQLSQIIPIPQHAWDKTSAGGPVGNYDETPSGAARVYAYLAGQSKDLRTYATNKLWQVVDGPWHLTSFTSTGEATFEPNPKYGGPDRPRVKKFIEVPFTSASAELNALRSGQLDVGYVPLASAKTLPQLKRAGFSSAPWDIYGFNSLFLNFNNPAAGPVFRQMYVREAMQELVNQPEYIKDALGGYGKPTYGPIINGPASLPNSSTRTNSYPYDPAKAKALLTSHGWSLTPGQAATCAHPGSGAAQCGPGVKAGAKLEFTLLTYSGDDVQSVEMQAYKTAAAEAGITISIKTVANVYAMAGRCTAAQAECSWQIADWGGAVFAGGNNYPLGAGYFFSTSSNNHENYVSATADQLDLAGRKPGGQIGPWESYIASALPMIWIPSAAFELVAARSNLTGVLPPNSLLSIFPQRWAYK
jgi:peptide/nickel transport system substrate-binding protein